jgi:hypothetical protein
MRPPGPDPATVVKSMPASRARRRLAGDAITRPWRAGAVFAGAAPAVSLTMTGAAAVCGVAGETAAGETAAGAAPDPSRSNTMSGAPTATLSPGAPLIDTTLPLTGAGTSTAALSVITSTMS